ncbi:hypothetical protein [Acinetobacter radioresistens]|nr:hypothetical protein [Acinetobacter radioresistens]
MKDLEKTQMYIEMLNERIEELKKADDQNPYAKICVTHLNDELSKLIKFLTP